MIPDFKKIIYIEHIHGNYLKSNLKIGHNTPSNIRDKLLLILKKYWCYFDPDGVSLPIRDYKASIDTGTHKPVQAKNIRYGIHESPIMEKAISALLSHNQIAPCTLGQWLSKATLAPKPHQEQITKIEEFIWRFCVNYIPLNQRTKIIAYPIPRCDDVVK